jgi:hypothetical protein
MLPILRFILIGSVVLVASILLYFLYRTRAQLSAITIEPEKGGFEGFSEAFDKTQYGSIEPFDGPAAGELQMMVRPTETRGTLVTLRQTELPIAQYVVKSSYNSAYTGGSYMSLDALKYCLQRGCRWVDFQVFNVDGAPRVGYTTDTTYVTLKTRNTLLLSDVLDTVVGQGFAGNVAPNSGDPIFVNLRICLKSNDMGVLGKIGDAIKVSLDNKLHQGIVSATTPMSELMGKIVLVVDAMICPAWADAPSRGDPKNLSNFANIVTGPAPVPKYSYDTIQGMAMSPPVIDADNLGTANVTQLTLVEVSATATSPPPAFSTQNLVANHGVQWYPQKMYVPKTDSTVTAYEELFAGCRGGIVPMSQAIRYYSTI